MRVAFPTHFLTFLNIDSFFEYLWKTVFLLSLLKSLFTCLLINSISPGDCLEFVQTYYIKDLKFATYYEKKKHWQASNYRTITIDPPIANLPTFFPNTDQTHTFPLSFLQSTNPAIYQSPTFFLAKISFV